MENLGSVFGLAGMSLGVIAFLRIHSLEKKLKKAGAMDAKYKFEKEI